MNKFDKLYVQAELKKILSSRQGNVKMKLTTSSSETKWLNVSLDKLEKIEKILTEE